MTALTTSDLPETLVCPHDDLRQVANRRSSDQHRRSLGSRQARRRTCAVPGTSGSEAEASPEWIVFRDDHDLVAVDFIGGDGAEGSIPCLEDDD